MARWLVIAILLAGVPLLAAGARADPATPAAVASPAACPVTQPNEKAPPRHRRGWYGNEWLSTSLYMWSDGPVVIVPDDGRIAADGTIHGMKWHWYRYVPGELTVEGRRLDAPSAPLVVHGGSGLSDRGFLAKSLTFPSAGCWEITGRVAGHELTFVTLVIVPDPAATPTPVS